VNLLTIYRRATGACSGSHFPTLIVVPGFVAPGKAAAFK
jgi:hypothetical protein